MDFQVPVDEQVVTITKPVLLDTATARLGGVEIRDGGRLVFSPTAGSVALTTRCFISSWTGVRFTEIWDFPLSGLAAKQFLSIPSV